MMGCPVQVRAGYPATPAPLRALPHPRPRILLPDEPGVADLADLCLRRAVDRSSPVADRAPPELDLRALKRSRVKHPGERLAPCRPLRSFQAVVAEVLPPAPQNRRRRPAAADVAGFVLLRREGDVVAGVDPGTCLHFYTRLHSFALDFTLQQTLCCRPFPDRGHILANSRYVCTGTDFTGTGRWITRSRVRDPCFW